MDKYPNVINIVDYYGNNQDYFTKLYLNKCTCFAAAYNHNPRIYQINYT